MDIRPIIISIVISLFGFAGGGGSSSGGGSSGGSSSSSGGSSYSSGGSSSNEIDWSKVDLTPHEPTTGEIILENVIISTIILGPIFILFIMWLYGRRRDKKIKNNIKPKQLLPNENSSIFEKDIFYKAKDIFLSYQNDWSNFNIENIAKYTTPHYHEHVILMLDLLKDLGRTNKVSNIAITDLRFHDSVKTASELPAKVSITFTFNGLDEVIDANGGTLYKHDARYVTEKWNFIYDGEKLLLDGISQPTESSSHLVKSLDNFAVDNNLFYSPDWGRYAVPSKGLIFDESSMKVSDINNHIVGKWGDLLIQLYTYAKTPSSPESYFLVGQISVPKKYLGVIVKSKQAHIDKYLKKDYDKFELEWGEFNERYDVYASKQDALPAFELLNPKFMEYFYEKNPNYSLEVIDNSIYIFANIKRITSDDYKELLDILWMAHKELKQ